jgi:enterochelin esterase-like enzyme
MVTIAMAATARAGAGGEARHKRTGAVGAATALLIAAFLAVGSLGAYRYVLNFWLYRGFPPPKDPAFVKLAGTEQQLYLRSAALGGRRQLVDAYLPPGYAQNVNQRYPVFYLLHGFPGRPAAFLSTVKLGVDEDVLVTEGRIRPVILVMPFGSTGTFNDKEWANGIGAHEGWEAFVARDVVRAIDARYRTISSASARAIGGLSEGGYGALNIALHHPGQFRVVESWSGYELADGTPSIFGGRQALIRYNSPLVRLRAVAPALRRRRTYFWFYSGSTESPSFRKQNADFAGELARARIPHRFFIISGGHNWAVWRADGSRALQVAANRLQHG